MVAKFHREHGVVFQPGRGFYRYESATGLWSRIKKLFSDDLAALARAYDVPALMTKMNEHLLNSLTRLLEGQAEMELASRRSGRRIAFR